MYLTNISPTPRPRVHEIHVMCLGCQLVLYVTPAASQQVGGKGETRAASWLGEGERGPSHIVLSLSFTLYLLSSVPYCVLLEEASLGREWFPRGLQHFAARAVYLLFQLPRNSHSGAHGPP